MALVCLPMGWFIGMESITAICVGSFEWALASFVERYEFGPIDDNVLIATASTILLIIGATFGPIV